MNIIKDILPEGAVLVRFMIEDTWQYDQMTILMFEGDTVHVKGWIGKPPTREHFQALSDLFPDYKNVVWERIREDGKIHPIKLNLPKPNKNPKAKIIENPCD